MAILVTGGAGYIGSHTCITLIGAGYDIIVFDNFSNASKESIQRVEKIVGKPITLIEGDIRNKTDLHTLFSQHSIEAVIHFAGYKAVGESVENPLKYYDNNVGGSIALLETMQEFECKSLVFSSSATVYGDPEVIPIKENASLTSTNPYARTKHFIEEILQDLHHSDPQWKIIRLRYFNPCGAHSSGHIGEDPNGDPNNLMPYITQTAIGKRSYLGIFGDDYDTHDGTGVRDYIHVVDLAQGHLQALKKLSSLETLLTVNLSTGKGYSVFDMLRAMEKATGRTIPYKILPRRAGDIAVCYADTSYAKEVLEWEATRSIEEMCNDSWKWQSNNPNGYKGES